MLFLPSVSLTQPSAAVHFSTKVTRLRGVIKTGGHLTGPNLPSHPNRSVFVTTNTDRPFSVTEVNASHFR